MINEALAAQQQNFRQLQNSTDPIEIEKLVQLIKLRQLLIASVKTGPQIMNINDAFPSKYLKAADLQGREVKVVIEKVEFETLGDDRKLVTYFQHKNKGLVTNKTNANRIAYAYGSDTDDWVGKEIILVSEPVDFQGRMVEAVRVKMMSKKPISQRAQQAAGMRPIQSNQELADDADMDDEIPF